MKTRLARPRTVRIAAMAASLALVAAACNKPGPTNNETDGTGVVGGLELTAGTLLVSNGTNEISLGGQKVIFPSTVTDAAWSPDGSRIAYLDGDGNVATAKPDGTSVVVLTAKNSSVVRSRPSWSRAFIFYAEKGADGTSTLMSVPTNGCTTEGMPATAEEWAMDTGDGTSYVDLSPSAATSVRPSRVAFQHDEPSGPEIWINDTNQRTPHTGKVVNGSEPALSLDGKKLVYVGTNGQVFVTAVGGNANPGVQITFGANQPSRLVWNPDEQHIAYRAANGIESVGISPGANSNPVTTIGSTPGVPALLPAQKNAVNRVTGADPIALGIAASQARWPTAREFAFGQGYLGAFGATITTPGQELAAAMTAKYDGPLLLTSAQTLDPRTKSELERLFGKVTPGSSTPDITIVGNEVSAGVEQALKSMGYETTRKPGAAQATATEGECGPQGGAGLFQQTVVVVDSASAADNAVGTVLAHSWYAPILRVNAGAGLDDALRAYLARTSGSFESVYIVDARGAISADLEKQIGQLISGPLGIETGANPTAPPLTY